MGIVEQQTTEHDYSLFRSYVGKEKELGNILGYSLTIDSKVSMWGTEGHHSCNVCPKGLLLEAKFIQTH